MLNFLHFSLFLFCFVLFCFVLFFYFHDLLIQIDGGISVQQQKYLASFLLSSNSHIPLRIVKQMVKFIDIFWLSDVIMHGCKAAWKTEELICG